MRIIVLDTNILVHFRRPDDPAWKSTFDGELLFVVPTTTLSELDSHKTSRDGKVRKRSKAILPWLEEYDDKEIADGVHLELLGTEPARDLLDKHDLDPGVPDDRIVAAALGLADTRSATVILLSADTTPRLKAKKRGLEAVNPPESLRLAEAPSAEEAELAEAQRQLNAFKNRLPKLRLSTPAGSFALGPDDWDKREEHIEQGMRRMQSSAARNPFQMLGLKTLPDGYMDQYRSYLQDCAVHTAYLGRCAKIPLHLENLGNLKANTLVVDLSWETETQYIEDLPRPPESPRRGAMDIRGLYQPLNIAGILGNRHVAGPDGDVGGQSCTYRVQFILHARTVELPPLHLCFPSIADVGGIALHWSIHCEELPEAASGCINLRATSDRTIEEMLRMTEPDEDE